MCTSMSAPPRWRCATRPWARGFAGMVSMGNDRLEEYLVTLAQGEQ